jgi:cytoskeletal protein RodZ
MSQISRPFQIALLAVAVLAAAWLFVFQAHPSTSASSSSSSAVVSSPAPAGASSAAEAKAAAAPTSIYHGSAPGVEGLTRAIAHAHGVVAQSQQNARQLQEKSAQASGQAASGTTSASPVKAAQPTKTAATPVSKVHHTTPPAVHALVGVPVGQRSVEAELAHGKIVVVLLWNPSGVEDVVVRSELKLLAKRNHQIAINVAPASQAASFGSITRGVQVYGTPTLLVIDKQGKAIVLNGLQDAFSIEQAINEARRA